jgi:glycosyltransferase involved in cell wall biosynthesis
MQVLIVTPIFPPEIGGPATYVYEVGTRLSPKHDLKIVTFGNQVDKLKGVPVKNIPLTGGPLARQARLFAAIWHQSKKTDLIYAQGPFVVGLAANLVAKLRRKPVVMKFVGDLVWETARGHGHTQKFLDDFLDKPDTGLKDRIKIRIQRWSFNQAKTVVVPSNYLKSVLTKFYHLPAKKVRVIYNAMDQELFKKIKKHPSNQKTKLVTVGRLVKWKHVDEIIQAVHQLQDKNIQLHIVGEGPEKPALQKLAHKLGLQKQVVFEGQCSHQETLELVGSSNVFILNSSYEGLPHTVIEAMLLNVPVIATRIKGTTEIAIPSKTAFLSEPGNPTDLAKQIQDCLQDSKTRDKYIKAASDLAFKNFNWTQNLTNLQEVWKS